MEHIVNLTCLVCGEEYSPDEIDYICPNHGNDGIVDVRYDYDRIRQRLSKETLSQNMDNSIWRYKPLLPVEADAAVLLLFLPFELDGRPYMMRLDWLRI